MRPFIMAFICLAFLLFVASGSAYHIDGYQNDRITNYHTSIRESAYLTGDESVSVKVTERVRINRRLPDDSGTMSTIRRSAFSRSFTGHTIRPTSGYAYSYTNQMHAPPSRWRNKPVYHAGDYGPDDYPAPSYYEPRYDYTTGTYDWRW
ncbi:MAG TPA: hypothetical protein VJK03_05205 [Candidatus Nanoarchaeia archaeon]|nr:hypothetical protein [Candidatus Nanoarchaeia archaeon]